MVGLPIPARRTLADGLVCAIGTSSAAPILDLDDSDAQIADFLVRVVHSDSGFVARTSSSARAMAIMAATVAALCGEDIREALRAPDTSFLRSLKPPAVEAVRAVLRAIETDDTERMSDAVHTLVGT